MSLPKPSIYYLCRQRCHIAVCTVNLCNMRYGRVTARAVRTTPCFYLARGYDYSSIYSDVAVVECSVKHLLKVLQLVILPTCSYVWRDPESIQQHEDFCNSINVCRLGSLFHLSATGVILFINTISNSGISEGVQKSWVSVRALLIPCPIFRFP